MADLQLTNSSGTVITSLSFGTIKPGDNYEVKLGIKNNTDDTIESVMVAPFPGIKSNQVDFTNGSPIYTARVIRRSAAGNNQYSSYAYTDSGGVFTTANSSNQARVIKYDGSSYTVYDSGNIPAMSSTNETLYILSDYIYPNIYLGFLNTGNYGTVNFALGSTDESTFYAYSPTDGTTKLSVDGILQLGTVNESNWGKVSINGYKQYPLRITCTGTVTTQATIDEVYFSDVFTASKSCLLGEPSAYYRKAAGPSYVACASPDYIYANSGVVAYRTSPLTTDEELSATFNYKNPQPERFDFSFTSASTFTMTTYSSGATSAYSVLANNSQKYTNHIAGAELVYSSTAANGNKATVTITDGLEYVWMALPSGSIAGTYQNKDLLLGNITAGSTTYFYMDVRPPKATASTDENTVYLSMFAYPG